MIGHGAPPDILSQDRTRRDNACLIFSRSDILSSINATLFAAIGLLAERGGVNVETIRCAGCSEHDLFYMFHHDS